MEPEGSQEPVIDPMKLCVGKQMTIVSSVFVR
jgi:hypothetical protein